MSAANPAPPSRWHQATPWALGLLAVAWTWPAAGAGADWLVGRHFDLQGTIWFIDAAPRVLSGLRDPLTAWPLGAGYGRADSWTLLALTAPLGWLDPVRLHNWIQVLGVWTAAWAAARFAETLGARAPWSWIAGATFGCSGLASTALLEGHVYHLMNAWLPLLGIAWWRATGPGGRWTHGLAAGACWSGCLLTTAYLGLAASLLVIGFGLGGLARRQLRPGPMLAAALVAGAVGGGYAASFSRAEARHAPDLVERFQDPERVMQHGAANLVTLAAPTPELDKNAHSNSSAVSPLAIALLLIAPVALRGRPGWRRVALTGTGVLLLTLGPALTDSRHLLAPMPLALLGDLPGAELLRFPSRLGWTWLLCAGALAAVVASRLAERAGRPAWALLGIAAVDAFVWGGMPQRQRTQLAAIPSAYAGEGPLLDLYPEYVGPVDEWHLHFQSLACYYQVHHGRALLDDCVAAYADASPRVRLQRDVYTRLLDGRDPSDLLAALGVRSLIFHPDLFPPGDAARLESALRAIDPAPTESLDGGERLLAFQIPGPPGPDPAAAWRAWSEGAL